MKNEQKQSTVNNKQHKKEGLQKKISTAKQDDEQNDEDKELRMKKSI